MKMYSSERREMEDAKHHLIISLKLFQTLALTSCCCCLALVGIPSGQALLLIMTMTPTLAAAAGSAFAQQSTRTCTFASRTAVSNSKPTIQQQPQHHYGLKIVPSLQFSALAATARTESEHTNNDNDAAMQKHFGFQPSILYESDRIVAIDKPTGISHHDDPETGEKGILSLLRQSQVEYMNNSRSDTGEYHGANNTNGGSDMSYQGRLYGVHRLDRVTSGILLLAKDADMASYLAKAFREKDRVTKYYIGISAKKPKKKKQGWVRGNMVRGRRKSWYLTDGRDKLAAPVNETVLSQQEQQPNMMHMGGFAETRFFSAGLGHLEPYCCTSPTATSDTKNGNAPSAPSLLLPKTCLLFRPLTGKTHQLRVAAKSIGLPLLGDPIYRDGSQINTTVWNSRTCLHAAAIQIRGEGGDNDDAPATFTIWSPPPFEYLWHDDAGKEGFRHAVSDLMRKHCDCHDITSKIQ